MRTQCLSFKPLLAPIDPAVPDEAGMRTRYIVTYDISDPKRLRLVFRVMRGFGDHLQLSVFSCELTPTERVRCESALRTVMNLNEDQVLFIDTGPAEGRGAGAVTSLGRPYTNPEWHAVVV